MESNDEKGFSRDVQRLAAPKGCELVVSATHLATDVCHVQL